MPRPPFVLPPLLSPVPSLVLPRVVVPAYFLGSA